MNKKFFFLVLLLLAGVGVVRLAKIAHVLVLEHSREKETPSFHWLLITSKRKCLLTEGGASIKVDERASCKLSLVRHGSASQSRTLFCTVGEHSLNTTLQCAKSHPVESLSLNLLGIKTESSESIDLTCSYSTSLPVTEVCPETL